MSQYIIKVYCWIAKNSGGVIVQINLVFNFTVLFYFL